MLPNFISYLFIIISIPKLLNPNVIQLPNAVLNAYKHRKNGSLYIKFDGQINGNN